jgi:hypothetical protein
VFTDLLNCHDYLHRIETVQAEIVVEVCLLVKLRLVSSSPKTQRFSMYLGGIRDLSFVSRSFTLFRTSSLPCRSSLGGPLSCPKPHPLVGWWRQSSIVRPGSGRRGRAASPGRGSSARQDEQLRPGTGAQRGRLASRIGEELFGTLWADGTGGGRYMVMMEVASVEIR